MKFKTFLLEISVSASRSKQISRDQAIALVKTRCKKALKIDHAVIVRGVDNKSDFSFSIPSLSTRTSANTSNEYTLVLDNSPEWDKFPKRSESLICGTVANAGYANDFGELHIVLPIDNWPTDIGVCSDFDLWTSFKFSSPRHGRNLEQLNSSIRMVFDAAVTYDIPGKDMTWEQFRQLCKETTDFLRDPTNVNTPLSNTWKNVTDGKMTFEEQVRHYLNPKDNGIKVMTYAELAQITDASAREVWLSNDSVLIKVPNDMRIDDAYQQFRDEVLKDEV
jgi:hypothetical protein